MRSSKVLIVEDNAVNIEIVASYLDSLEIEYDIARNGQEAVDTCREYARDYYRLILMDVHMPVLDGYQATRIIKAELGVPAPIVLCTATDLDSPLMREHKCYINGCIQKPFYYEEFCSVIQAHLGIKGRIY